MDDVSQRCSICLDTVAPENEAFLDHCFHKFCYHCILQWAETAGAARFGDGPVRWLECPLCTNRYSSIIHNLHGKRFQRHYVVPSSARFSMSEAHLRRQAVYSSPQGHIQQSSAPVLIPSEAKRASAVDVIELVNRNRWLRCWVQRELQALMEVALPEAQELCVTDWKDGLSPDFKFSDVGFRKKTTKSGRKLKEAKAMEADWRIALSTAVQPFLFENSVKFVEEIESFLSAGLDIPTFDDVVKQRQASGNEQQLEIAVNAKNAQHVDQWSDHELPRRDRLSDDKETKAKELIARHNVKTDGPRRDRDSYGEHNMGATGSTALFTDSSDEEGDPSGDGHRSRSKRREARTSHVKREARVYGSQSPVPKSRKKKKYSRRHRSVDRWNSSPPKYMILEKKRKRLSPAEQDMPQEEELTKLSKKSRQERSNYLASEVDAPTKRRGRSEHRSRSASPSSGSCRSSSRSGNRSERKRKNQEGTSQRKGKGSRCTDKAKKQSCDVNSLIVSDDKFMHAVQANSRGASCMEKESVTTEEQCPLLTSAPEPFKVVDAGQQEEAESEESRLRKQALANLMRHLESGRKARGRGVQSGEVIEVPRSKDVVHDSCGFDRHRPEASNSKGVQTSVCVPTNVRIVSAGSGPEYENLFKSGFQIMSEASIDPQCMPVPVATQHNEGRSALESYDKSTGVSLRGCKEKPSVGSAISAASTHSRSAGKLNGEGFDAVPIMLPSRVGGDGTALSSMIGSRALTCDNTNDQDEGGCRLSDSTPDGAEIPKNVLPSGGSSSAIESGSPQGQPRSEKRRKLRRDFDLPLASHPTLSGSVEDTKARLTTPTTEMSFAQESMPSKSTSVSKHFESVAPYVGHGHVESPAIKRHVEGSIGSPNNAELDNLSHGQPEVGNTESVSVGALPGSSSTVVQALPGSLLAASNQTSECNGAGLLSVSNRDCTRIADPLTVQTSDSSILTQDVELQSQLSKVASASGGHPLDTFRGGDRSQRNSGINTAMMNGVHLSQRRDQQDGSHASHNLKATVSAEGSLTQVADPGKIGRAVNDAAKFKQKTFSVLRGGESVEVSYKVYIPERAAARAAERKLKRYGELL